MLSPQQSVRNRHSCGLMMMMMTERVFQRQLQCSSTSLFHQQDFFLSSSNALHAALLMPMNQWRQDGLAPTAAPRHLLQCPAMCQLAPAYELLQAEGSSGRLFSHSSALLVPSSLSLLSFLSVQPPSDAATSPLLPHHHPPPLLPLPAQVIFTL